MLVSAAAHADMPTVTDANGVVYKLVNKDFTTGQIYSSANGFCTLAGYAYPTYWESTLDDPGPFAILDAQGNLVQTFPDAGNENRFEVIIDIGCSN